MDLFRGQNAETTTFVRKNALDLGRDRFFAARDRVQRTEYASFCVHLQL